jgi:hypothetical protein
MGKLIGGVVLGSALLLATVHQEYGSPSHSGAVNPSYSHGVRLPEHQPRIPGGLPYRGNDAAYRDSGEPYAETGPLVVPASAILAGPADAWDWPEP